MTSTSRNIFTTPPRRNDHRRSSRASHRRNARSWLFACLAVCLCCIAAAADVPATSEVQLLLASDGIAHDSFGRALEREGSTLIVGAPQDNSSGLNGSFYVFVESGSQQWIEQERIFSPFKAVDGYGDEFGSALALEGDTLFVGAPLTHEGSGFAGRTYVFVRDETNEWTHLQTLLSPPSPRFGQSIALAGDTAVITSQYQAYIFTRDDSGTWVQEAELSANTVGTHVAFDGQTLIIYGRFSTGDVGGVIYLNQDGAWAPSATIALPTANPYTFARDVSLDGNQLAMGITDPLGQDRTFMYERDASGAWIQQAMLDPDSLEGDNFGSRVALAGDLLLVSAPTAGLGGTVYVYQRTAGDWAQTVQLVPSDGFFGQYFGSALRFDQGMPIVGSSHHENGLHAGGAYVFDVILSPVPGDITGDGVVNVNDLLAVISAWGPCPDCAAVPCAADLHADCIVDVNDLLMVINSWG